MKNRTDENLCKKSATLEEAVSLIQPGDRVFFSSACATPISLLEALQKGNGDPASLQRFHLLPNGIELHRFRESDVTCRAEGLQVTVQPPGRTPIHRAGYLPVNLSQMPRLIRSGKIPIDVACVQVSPPDDYGFVSLGVSVDISRTAVQEARKVIAEVNPNMPRTHGDNLIPLDQVCRFVYVSRPLIEWQDKPSDAVSERISRLVARLINDGSTLHVGRGEITNEMLKHLTNRKDLGIHSDVVTEPVADLIEQGVVTGNAKSIHKGRVVASYCMGTRRLYDLVHDNPLFAFYPIDYVCDPMLISANRQVVSVAQAHAVDLTGQVCIAPLEHEYEMGISTQPEFLRGAIHSPGGKPVICLRSTTSGEKESRIRPLLKKDEGVTVPRTDVHYVITEYGCAYLFGKSLQERAHSLIHIAHPSFRAWLLEEAGRLGYLPEKSVFTSLSMDSSLPAKRVTLKNNATILIRPSQESDVTKLRAFFDHMCPEDMDTRFFTNLRSLAVPNAEHLCRVDCETEMTFVAVNGSGSGSHIVGSASYNVDPSTNMADVAYLIRPEWQGIGLGKALQKRMIEYARAQGLRGFQADILMDNDKMIGLIERSGCTLSKKKFSGVYETSILF